MHSENIEETLYKKKVDTMNILNIFDAKNFVGKTNVVISGVTGQDGSHMVDYLLKNTDATIFGGVRRLSVYNHKNLRHINSDRFHLINFDLTDSHAISRTVEVLKPDYFVNFAAQSFVASSWDFARQTWQTNSTSVLDILEAIRQYHPTCRFYNAGSSEEFGNVQYSPQDEKHPLRPRSPYAASKAAARQIVKVYRESYNLYAVQGWLFNHEGERRGEEFVTRKITKHVANIFKDLRNGEIPTPMELGNVNAKRDWSYAPDFVDGVWKMLNQNQPKDYVLASGENHSIKEFVELAFEHIGISGEWTGKDLDEIYWGYKNPNMDVPTVPLVKINPKFYRPAEVDCLIGDSTLARRELGWEPKTDFKELVKIMVESDIKS